MKKEFLDLGRQPIANKFLKKDEVSDEFFFDLKVVFDEDTKLPYIKFGITDNIEHRIKQLSGTSSPLPFKLHFAIKVKDEEIAHQIENRIKDGLSFNRKNPKRYIYRNLLW